MVEKIEQVLSNVHSSEGGNPLDDLNQSSDLNLSEDTIPSEKTDSTINQKKGKIKKSSLKKEISEESSKQDAKWVFRMKGPNDEELYSVPTDLKSLMSHVEKMKYEGTFCLCVIIPDFSTKTHITFDVGSSQFLKNGAKND